MKIIHLIADANTGGGQVYVLNLLQQFQIKPYELVVICPEAGYYVEEYEKYANTVYRIDWQQPHFQLFRLLRKIFNSEQPHYIHNHLWKACFFGTLAGQLVIRKTIFNHLHGDLIIYNFENRLQFRFFQALNFFLTRLRCHYICVSLFEKKILSQYGVPKQKMTVIYNGVDTNHFAPTPTDYTSEQIFNVLCVARLHPAKGINTLIEACKLLPANITVSLLGDGPLKDEVCEKVATAGITNLKLLGYQKDIRPYLAKAHLFVLPSRWESFGIALIEAMATSKAVVATRVGGIPELIVEGKGGFLCEPHDIQCLSERIIYFQTNPEYLLKFGKANRKKAVQLFSLEKVIQKIMNLYGS